jgi:phage repressor protein C with HTH and peptisase S24 domain
LTIWLLSGYFPSMPNYIRAWREFRGLSQEQLGAAASTDKTQISKLEREERRLTLDWMERLAPALNIRAADLTHPPPDEGAESSRRSLGHEENVVAAATPQDLYAARDLAVYASAQGGPTGMLVTPEPIEWITRPPPLSGVMRGYAVYVVNDSMEPAYRHGDMAYVHPGIPPRRGDDVLIYRVLNGDWAALVKQLVGWNDKAWKVRQHNPAKEFSLARAEWPHLNVIVGRQNRR